MQLVGHELASQLFVGLQPAEQTKVLRSLLGKQAPVDEAELEEICREFVEICQKDARQRTTAVESPRESFAGLDLPRHSRVADICEEIPDWILIEHLRQQLDAVVTAVLGFLDAKRAGVVFKGMPEIRQPVLLQSLSQERVLDDKALQDLEADLEDLKRRSFSGRYGQRVGGPQRVLALVQAMDVGLRSRLLEEVALREPELAAQITDGLLSLERLAELLPAHLVLLLSQMKDAEIGGFLRGESVELQRKYLSAVSSRRREDIECLLSPEKKITQNQKAEACERLRACALRLKEEGRILFPWEEALVG